MRYKKDCPSGESSDGHALGARRATDEYFADPARRILLHRVNFTNRIGIKL
jgi:hypothetical protein